MKKSEAIALFGGVPALAGALGISRSAIYQWGEEIREPRASQIKLLAQGRSKGRRRAHNHEVFTGP